MVRVSWISREISIKGNSTKIEWKERPSSNIKMGVSLLALTRTIPITERVNSYLRMARATLEISLMAKRKAKEFSTI